MQCNVCCHGNEDLMDAYVQHATPHERTDRRVNRALVTLIVFLVGGAANAKELSRPTAQSLGTLTMIGAAGGGVAGLVEHGRRVYAAVGARIVATRQDADRSLTETGSSEPVQDLLGALTASDGYVYALGGRFTDQDRLDETVVYAFDVVEPDQPRRTARVDLGGVAEDIAARGMFVLAALGQDGVAVLHRNETGALAVVARMPNVIGAQTAEWTDDQMALIGYAVDAVGGMVIVDMQDPAHPMLRGQVSGLGPVLSIVRNGAIAYIGTGRPGAWGDDTARLYTIDVSNVDSPRAIGSIQSSTIESTGVGIEALAIDGDRLFGITTPEKRTDVAYVTVWDVSDTSQPALLSSSATIDGRTVSIAKHSVYIASGAGGIELCVFSQDVAGIQTSIAYSSYDATAITSAGTLGVVGTSVGEIVTVDLADSVHIRSTSRAALAFPNIVTGVAAMSAGAVAVRAQSYLFSHSAIERYLIDSENALHQSGWLETGGQAEDVELSGSTAFVITGDMGTTRAYDVAAPSEPILIGEFQRTPNSDEFLGLSRVGDVLFIASSSETSITPRGTVISVDVRDPGAMRMLGALELPGWMVDVTSVDDTVVVASESGGLWIVDASDRTQMRVTSHIDDIVAHRVVLDGDTLYALIAEPDLQSSTSDVAALLVIDLSHLDVPRKVAQLALPLMPARSFGQGLAVSGGDLLVAAGDGGLLTFRLKSGSLPGELWLPMVWKR